MSEVRWRFQEHVLKNPIGDLIGGLMAAIVALPLCLAFGEASGIGAAAGLYGAIACGIFAALFGGTPGQCSGPTGPMTVVAAAMYAANPNRPDLVFAAILTAGVIQIGLGCAKTGQLIGYVPYPVISGFMTGIGAIICCIELGPLFGAPSSGSVLTAMQNLIGLPRHGSVEAAAIGVGTLMLINLLPLLSKRLPASLIALVIATWVCHALKLQIPVIGEIPTCLPLPKLPLIDITSLHLVAQNALTLALLGAIDSLLTSLVLDKAAGVKHNSDQELIGQGIGNMLAGLVGGLPGAGATMRSMVNVKSGGTTKLSGAAHGMILLVILVFLGKIAGMIPLAALAAILICVGFNIMDWRVLRGLRKMPKSDLLVMVVVLGLTIFVDLIVAVLVGVALASVLFVKQLADAQVSSIGSLETLEELCKLTEHIPESVRKSTYSYSLNGPLFFGEAKNLAASIDQLTGAKYVILRFVNVPLIDQTGAYALENAIERWESEGIKVLFVSMPVHVRRVLEDTGTVHKFDPASCFSEFEGALEEIDRIESLACTAEQRSNRG